MPWAILHDYYDIDGSHRPYLLGYGFWNWERPRHLGGYKTATFEKRREARAERKRFGKGYRVVHVEVKVKQTE